MDNGVKKFTFPVVTDTAECPGYFYPIFVYDGKPFIGLLYIIIEIKI